MKGFFSKCWRYYRQSGLLPIFLLIILYAIPPIFKIGFLVQTKVIWPLALIVIIMMYDTGFYQLKNGMRAKGIFNIIAGIILMTFYLIPFAAILSGFIHVN